MAPQPRTLTRAHVLLAAIVWNDGPTRPRCRPEGKLVGCQLNIGGRNTQRRAGGTVTCLPGIEKTEHWPGSCATGEGGRRAGPRWGIEIGKLVDGRRTQMNASARSSARGIEKGPGVVLSERIESIDPTIRSCRAESGVRWCLHRPPLLALRTSPIVLVPHQSGPHVQ